jgi:hypothetical protein
MKCLCLNLFSLDPQRIGRITCKFYIMNFIETEKSIKEGKKAFMPFSELCVSLHQASQLYADLYRDSRISPNKRNYK